MKSWDLQIILPTYNEAACIEKVIVEWNKELKHKLKYNFIICEDGSTDGTKEIIKKLAKEYPITLSMKPQRGGYAAAVVRGINLAKSKYILCIDSDGQCPAKDFWKFWKNKEKADILTGWRVARQDTPQRKLLSGFFKLIYKVLFPVTIHDPSCPYVLFSKDVSKKLVRNLGVTKEAFWWEFIARSHSLGLTINEYKITHRLRFDGKTQVYKVSKWPKIFFSQLFAMYKIKQEYI